MPYTYESALEAIEDEEIKSAILDRVSALAQKADTILAEKKKVQASLRDTEAALTSTQSEIQTLLEGADPSTPVNQVVQKVSKEKQDLQKAYQRMKGELDVSKSALEKSEQELKTLNRKYTLQEVGRLTGLDSQVLGNIAAIDIDAIEIADTGVIYNGQSLEQAIASDPNLRAFLPSLRKEKPPEQPRSPSLSSTPSNPTPTNANKTDLVAEQLRRTRPNFNRG